MRLKENIKELFRTEKEAQQYFTRKHEIWNTSVWKHPIAHICLAITHRRQPNIMFMQCYLAICAPVATYIRIKKERKAKEA